MNRSAFKPVATVGAVLFLALYYAFGPPAQPGAGGVAGAYEAQKSGVMVEDRGTVTRLLPDDREGSPHQRFIVEIGTDLTVLVALNIELAPRIETLRSGDEVAFRGRYEYTPKGGVVHWTHHDPQGRHPGGWIDHGGRRYE